MDREYAVFFNLDKKGEKVKLEDRNQFILNLNLPPQDQTTSLFLLL